MGKLSYSSWHFKLGTGWKWVISFQPRKLYPRENTLSSNCIGADLSPGTGIDAVETRIIFLPCPESKPDSAIVLSLS
jgi:hypothetical protein